MNLLQWEKRNYENRIRFATFESARRGLSPTCFLALHLLEWFQQREAQIYIAVCEREGKRCSVALPLSLSPYREREKESLHATQFQAHARSIARECEARGWLASAANRFISRVIIIYLWLALRDKLVLKM